MFYIHERIDQLVKNVIDKKWNTKMILFWTNIIYRKTTHKVQEIRGYYDITICLDSFQLDRLN